MLENKCRPYSINAAVLLLDFCANKCSRTALNRPYSPLDFCAWIQCSCTLRFLCINFLGKCAKTPARPPSLSALLPSHEKWKSWSHFASLNPFWLNPKWASNPTVEKDPIQWMRFSESKNPFYLNHLNKITHPLKFIKKWLYVYKVSLNDI